MKGASALALVILASGAIAHWSGTPCGMSSGTIDTPPARSASPAAPAVRTGGLVAVVNEKGELVANPTSEQMRAAQAASAVAEKAASDVRVVPADPNDPSKGVMIEGGVPARYSVVTVGADGKLTMHCVGSADQAEAVLKTNDDLRAAKESAK